MAPRRHRGEVYKRYRLGAMGSREDLDLSEFADSVVRRAGAALRASGRRAGLMQDRPDGGGAFGRACDLP